MPKSLADTKKIIVFLKANRILLVRPESTSYLSEISIINSLYDNALQRLRKIKYDLNSFIKHGEGQGIKSASKAFPVMQSTLNAYFDFPGTVREKDLIACYRTIYINLKKIYEGLSANKKMIKLSDVANSKRTSDWGYIYKSIKDTNIYINLELVDKKNYMEFVNTLIHEASHKFCQAEDSCYYSNPRYSIERVQNYFLGNGWNYFIKKPNKQIPCNKKMYNADTLSHFVLAYTEKKYYDEVNLESVINNDTEQLYPKIRRKVDRGLLTLFDEDNKQSPVNLNEKVMPLLSFKP